MPREENSWADWLARVAAHVKRDVDLEEFAEAWPTDDVAPKEVGNVLFRAGGGLEPQLKAALETVETAERQKTLQSWVSARQQNCKIRKLSCDKCGKTHIDHDWYATHNHTWHVCQHCDHKFKSDGACVGTPLPEDIPLTTEHVEAAGKVEEVVKTPKEAGRKVEEVE